MNANFLVFLLSML